MELNQEQSLTSFSNWKVSAKVKKDMNSQPRGRSVKVLAIDILEAIKEGEKALSRFSLWNWEIVEAKKME